jgi:hypothetical protein
MQYDTIKRKLEDEARHYAHRNQHQLTPLISDGREPQSWFACCTKCGMRVMVRPDHGIRLEGAATVQPCDQNALRLLEAKAWVIGESAELLWQRLEQVRQKLVPAQQDRFWPGEFQPEHYRFVSDDGLIALVWKLRAVPDQPIHDGNRQSKTGIVEMVTLVEPEAMFAARYIGEGNDPNDPDDEGEWAYVPLETGELGFAYQDDLGYWRFKRADGTIGFYVEEHELEFLSEAAGVDADNADAQSADANSVEAGNAPSEAYGAAEEVTPMK